MIARRILSFAVVVACGTLASAGSADASMTGTGSLALSCYLTTSVSESCTGGAPPYSVPGQYSYTETFSSSTGSGAITDSDIYAGPANGSLGSAGFIDDYLFTIAPASVDAVSSTISLNGTFGISDLFERIYSLTDNSSGLVLTQPQGTVYYGDITNDGSATLVSINPVTLTAGSYVLELSGTVTGSQGGIYTGQLNLSPVPLPPSFPLLLVGLLGFAGLVLKRSRNR